MNRELYRICMKKTSLNEEWTDPIRFMKFAPCFSEDSDPERRMDADTLRTIVKWLMCCLTATSTDSLPSGEMPQHGIKNRITRHGGDMGVVFFLRLSCRKYCIIKS